MQLLAHRPAAVLNSRLTLWSSHFCIAAVPSSCIHGRALLLKAAPPRRPPRASMWKR